MYKFSTMKNGSLKQFQKYRQGCWKRLVEPLFLLATKESTKRNLMQLVKWWYIKKCVCRYYGLSLYKTVKNPNGWRNIWGIKNFLPTTTSNYQKLLRKWQRGRKESKGCASGNCRYRSIRIIIIRRRKIRIRIKQKIRNETIFWNTYISHC